MSFIAVFMVDFVKKGLINGNKIVFCLMMLIGVIFDETGPNQPRQLFMERANDFFNQKLFRL